MSETSKYRHLTLHYCRGLGIDIGAGDDPITPEAIRIELPEEEHEKYTGSKLPSGTHLTVQDHRLPFLDGCLDYVYSSHLLEDFADWNPVLLEWWRVLKPGGRLVIILPDLELWALAVANGQPPNDRHQHEAKEWEISETLADLRLVFRIIRDNRTSLFHGDYSILFVGVKT